MWVLAHHFSCRVCFIGASTHLLRHNILRIVSTFIQCSYDYHVVSCAPRARSFPFQRVRALALVPCSLKLHKTDASNLLSSTPNQSAFHPTTLPHAPILHCFTELTSLHYSISTTPSTSHHSVPPHTISNGLRQPNRHQLRQRRAAEEVHLPISSLSSLPLILIITESAAAAATSLRGTTASLKTRLTDLKKEIAKDARKASTTAKVIPCCPLHRDAAGRVRLQVLRSCAAEEAFSPRIRYAESPHHGEGWMLTCSRHHSSEEARWTMRCVPLP